MAIVNATPHESNIRAADGSMIAVKPCGTVVRCAETRVADGALTVPCPECAAERFTCERHAGMASELPRISLTRVEYGAVEGLEALTAARVCPACDGDGWAADCCECGGVGTLLPLLRSGDVLVVSAIAATRIAAMVDPVAGDGWRGAKAVDLPAGVIVCCPGPAIREAAEGRIVGCDGLTVVCST